ncbi:MAG: aerotolerance regulator BatA [Elusimicrobia bacterium CG06_land_8_20_14_3_00_38_11]|nr:MAG: aerotolerance regulator BatA [Elusimicrobia bacterium CG06_land_8_20_14_3_00_38_11]
MRFFYPYFLLLIPILLLGLYYKKKKKLDGSSRIIYSDIKIFGNLKVPSGKKITDGLKIIAVILVIIALARPQGGEKSSDFTKNGIDIILCIDTSTSMLAEDFKPQNRLEAAKEVVKKFIKARKDDRIGVVVFSAVAFTQCPLTTDYGSLLDFIDKIEIGMTQTDGTAIGTAILTSVNRLKDSTGKSKIIILLTDGRNNMGDVDPVTASKSAAAFGIKIYTIGAAGIGASPYPVDDPIFGKRYVWMKEDLDEPTLLQIARETDGLYFRAKNKGALEEIYKKINAMEKTEYKTQEYADFNELYIWFLIPAVLLFIVLLFLRIFVFRTVP